MSVNTPTPEELREALRPLRPDPAAFEEGVRERLGGAEEAERADNKRIAATSPFVRAAASFLPIPLLGGKALLASAKAGPVGPAYKLLGFLALPAVSIFLVLGAFVFSALHIRGTSTESAGDEAIARDALRAWWRKHWWIALPFYLGVLATFFWASSNVIFTLLLVSFVVLAIFLTALSRAGLATRGAIARVCALGMLYIALPIFIGSSGGTLGLFDTRLAAGVLGLGGILLVAFGGPWVAPGAAPGAPPSRGPRLGLVLGMLPLTVFGLNTFVRPATPGTMQRYVESFDEALFHTATWHKWEVAATWLRDSGREVDWSVPRRFLLDGEIKGEQNSYVLGVAMRIGLLHQEDFTKLRDLTKERERLLGGRRQPFIIGLGHGFNSLLQQDWVIRVLAADGSLREEDRDLLASQLESTWDGLRVGEYDRLEKALVIARLRDVLERPGDVASQQADVHGWLRHAYRAKRVRYRPNGGFRGRSDGPTDDMATWAGVCLMERYGTPKGIDAITVRSSARNQGNLISGPDFVTAATRWKVDALRDGGPPTIGDYLKHERTLIASILLVLLALYATLRAPRIDAPEFEDVTRTGV